MTNLMHNDVLDALVHQVGHLPRVTSGIVRSFRFSAVCINLILLICFEEAIQFISLASGIGTQ